MTTIRSILSLAVSVAVSAALVGCAGQAPSAGLQASVQAAPTAKVIPVCITPNCTIIAGQQHCQWITPPGHQQPSEPAPAKQQVKGIAL